jgi:phosphoglycolate phosphatase
MHYNLAIFDFDGTLADSFPLFASVFNQLAQRHGFRTVEPQEAEALRRRNAREIMHELGMPAWKLPIVASSFVGLMRSNASSVPLFEGVGDMLKVLAAKGVVLAIVTSNAQDNVTQVLGSGNARLVSHFECGASIFGKRSKIRKVLKASGIPSGQAIYIGDQPTDLEAARAEGVAFGAVTWGYGHIDSMSVHAPEATFTCVSEIARTLET